MLKFLFSNIGVIFKAMRNEQESLPIVLKVGDDLVNTSWFEKSYQKVTANEKAKELIQVRYHGKAPSVEELRQYPANTVGYMYSRHILDNGLQTYPRQDCSRMSDRQYVKERSREFHDLLHVVLGFGTRVQDEVGINMAMVFQNRYPMSILIAFGGLIKIIFTHIQALPETIRLMRRGWQIGRQAEFIYAVRWEEYWSYDLFELRRELGIS